MLRRTLSSAPKAPGCACEYRLAVSMRVCVSVRYTGVAVYPCAWSACLVNESVSSRVCRVLSLLNGNCWVRKREE